MTELEQFKNKMVKHYWAHCMVYKNGCVKIEIGELRDIVSNTVDMTLKAFKRGCFK